VAAPSTTAAAPLSRTRRIVVWVLVVLGTIIALVAILTTWVKRQMLDNTAWNKATTQMVQDPKVQSAIATYTINQLYQNVNVGQALSDRLPPNLKQLGPPLAGALEQPATQGVERLLTRVRSPTRSSSTCSRTRPATESRPATASSRSTSTR
jgi:hypothetical protein